VLEATRQLIDNYLREAVLHGDLRRFLAELERGVGRRFAPPPARQSNPPASGSKFDTPNLPAPRPDAEGERNPGERKPAVEEGQAK
jgi:hypothetical protein